ncbi:MAG: methyltransferase [Bacteroidia bacterium]
MLDKKYWESRYSNDNAPWDAAVITTPIKGFIDSLADKNQKILVPGAGNGHEFEYLVNSGFTNAYMLDIAEQPLKNAARRMPHVPADRFILADFFKHKAQYDLIIEQTFFCALHPELRDAYVTQMHYLLAPGGILAGLMFNFPLTETGPPFGGSPEEYTARFIPYFGIRKMEPAYNSIKPRHGRELFVIFEKK